MSGVLTPPPGVPSLPEHWRVAKLKHVAAVRASNVDKKTEEGERPVRLCNYVDVYYNSRITADMEFMEASASPLEIQRFRLREGDVLVTKDSEAWDDIAVPALVTRDFNDVLCGYHLAQIRPIRELLDGRFLYYCFAADTLNRQLQVSANGVTRFGLPLGALSGAVFPLPPLHEQREIGGFLDEKVCSIDGLVGKLERLIGLAEESRAAAILKLVTQGLGNQSLSDSGVSWIGGIPLRWEVVSGGRSCARASSPGSSQDILRVGSTPNTGYLRSAPFHGSPLPMCGNFGVTGESISGIQPSRLVPSGSLTHPHVCCPQAPLSCRELRR